jgi:hypothetical protein
VCIFGNAYLRRFQFCGLCIHNTND